MPKAGWHVQWAGEPVDLNDWKRTLNEPFDPFVEEFPDGTIALCSTQFDKLKSAQEVRSAALILIARLNGALRLTAAAQPLKLNNIIQIDDEGRRHATIFAEAAAFAFGRATATFTAVLLGADGTPLPPPPPQPSDPQKWLVLASSSDLYAALLDHFGRAENWYDIYKTIEVAEKLKGGEKALQKAMGSLGKDLKSMRSSANFHRHFSTYRPAHLFDLPEAKNLLSQVVRLVLSIETA